MRGLQIAAVLISLAIPCHAQLARLSEDYQVLQRDANDQASCQVVLSGRLKSFPVFQIKAVHENGTIIKNEDVRPGGEGNLLIEGLPVGGPYKIEVIPKAGNPADRLLFRNILVGDIWILAGQSTMFGFNVPDEELPALPYMNMLDIQHFLTEAHWAAGYPPIHRAHEKGKPNFLRLRTELTESQIQEWIRENRPIGGIDVSYFFAKKLYAESGVPIGFIPAAIGAALAVWDPAGRDKNRYGFLHRHVMSAGGRVKGMLWAQGGQEAIYGDENETLTKPSLIYPISTYAKEFKKFVEAMRKDFDNPGMPVIMAQIGRHHQGDQSRHRYWEMMRDIQRQMPEHVANVHVVPIIDLDVFDGTHLDVSAYKRLGPRMAYLALPYVKNGVARRSEIKLKSVRFADPVLAKARRGEYLIEVEFEGVSGHLTAPGRPTGFQLREKATGETGPWIYQVRLDPKHPGSVTLNWRMPPAKAAKARDANGKWDLLLYYGPGSAPYVNIVDENDMAVPAFGPIEVK